jgi:hypothetical protein
MFSRYNNSNVFQYISHKMQLYTVYLYLETALHVLGGTSTHHQERIQLYLQHLVSVTPLLLPAAIVEELELFHLYIVNVCGRSEQLSSGHVMFSAAVCNSRNTTLS